MRGHLVITATTAGCAFIDRCQGRQHPVSVSGHSGSTAAVPPGTEGAGRNVIVGLVCLFLGVVLLGRAGLDASTAVIAIGTLLCLGGLFVSNAGRQRLRARRVGRMADQCSWAGVCYLSGNQFMLRALVVDIDGVHLSTLGGRRLTDWPWPTLANALAMPVTTMSGERPGLTLDTKEATPSASLVFPRPSGVDRNGRHRRYIAAVSAVSKWRES